MMRRVVLALFLLLCFPILLIGKPAGLRDSRSPQVETDIEDIDAIIISPDSVNDQVAMFHVDADKYPSGITIINVQITLPSDAAYTMTFEEWAGDPPAAQNDIEAVTTTSSDAYKEVTDADIDDQSVDADDYIFLDIPATEVDWVHVKVIFTY